MSTGKSMFPASPIGLLIGGEDDMVGIKKTLESRSWHPTTGDLVLISRCPGSVSSAIVGNLTASEWTHAGVVVSGTDATPTCHSTLLFESVSSNTDPMPDALMGWRRRTGVRCVELSARLREIIGRDDRVVAVRRPKPRPRGLGDCARAMTDRYRGGEYGIEYGQVISLMRSERDGVECAFVDSNGVRAIERRADSAPIAFCSQLVAEFYAVLGVLPREIDTGTYTPGDFAVGHRVDAEVAKTGHGFSEPIFMFKAVTPKYATPGCECRWST